MTTIQDRIINANISIQKVAYEMANARDKAFKAGEIKDGKTTDEWNEYRKAKVKLSQVISQSIKEVEEETRKEIFDNLPKVIEPPEDIEKFKEKRQAFLAGQINMLMRLNDLSLSITNKEKQNV